MRAARTLLLKASSSRESVHSCDMDATISLFNVPDGFMPSEVNKYLTMFPARTEPLSWIQMSSAIPVRELYKR